MFHSKTEFHFTQRVVKWISFYTVSEYNGILINPKAEIHLTFLLVKQNSILPRNGSLFYPLSE